MSSPGNTDFTQTAQSLNINKEQSSVESMRIGIECTWNTKLQQRIPSHVGEKKRWLIQK